MAAYVDPYKPQAAQQAANNPTATSSKGTTAGTTSGTSSQNSTTNSTTNQSSTNMDPASLAALNLLIKQLMTGGTAAQKADEGAKATEVSTLQTQRAGYSKEAAFADAQGLIAKTMREAIEKMLPAINQGALGSGASQSSMRALLTQKAAQNAAETASAQGLQAAVSYGGVSNGMSGAIGNLLNQPDPVTAALIQALNVAKGAVTNSTTNQSGSSTQNGTTSGTTSGATQEDKAITYGGLPPVGPSSNTTSWGPVDNGGSGGANNSTTQFLNELYGKNAYSDYTF